jgi:hypothetical protein
MQEANLRLEMDKTPDRQSTSVQDILAKSAFEKPSFANSSDKQDAPSASRAGMVLAQGLGEGIWAKTKDAVAHPFETASTVAETFTIGYGLGALSKAGPLGQRAAMVAGAGMGAYWVASEFIAGRPQATFNAVNEAYHSGRNIDKNREQIAATGGAMAFDTMLAIGAGGLGARQGFKVKENWHHDFLSNSALNPTVSPLGRAFAGKEAKLPAHVETAREIVADKSKSTGSFGDIEAQLRRGRLKEDLHLQEAKSQLSNLTQEHASLSSKETTLAGKLTKLSTERADIDGLVQPRQNLTRAQEALQSARQMAESLPEKRATNDRLFNEKEAARETLRRGESPTQEGQISPERRNFETRQRAFEEAKRDLEQLKAMAGPEAQQRAQGKVVEAERALKTAEAEKPTKLAEIDGQISSTQQEMTGVKARKAQIEEQMSEGVGRYQTRLTELEANPDLLVKAEKPAIAEKPKTEIDKPKIIEDKPDPVAIAQEALTIDTAAKHKITEPVLEAKPEIKAEPKLESPSTSTALQAANKAVEPVREQALKAVRENEFVREMQAGQKTLDDIARGQYNQRPGQNLEQVKQSAQRRMDTAREALGNERPASYTRSLKLVSEYARGVSRQMAVMDDAGARGNFAIEAVAQLESMMNRLPNSYKGYQDKLPDLPEPGPKGAGSPERRLAMIQEHLESKARLLDQSRNRQIHDMVESQPTLREVLKRQEEGTLPADGTLILFDKNGRFINQPGTRSPHFVEVKRLNEGGVGADGAGFNRFANSLNDIAGAVILRPIYENGKPVEVPNRNSNGKPVYKKTVSDTIGEIPEGIKPELNFTEILRRFAP